MNKATESMDKQKRSGHATKGFDKMSARVVVGWGSYARREGDQTERTMLVRDGIRLPVTKEKNQRRAMSGGITYC